jgi:hypothetical protein
LAYEYSDQELLSITWTKYSDYGWFEAGKKPDIAKVLSIVFQRKNGDLNISIPRQIGPTPDSRVSQNQKPLTPLFATSRVEIAVASLIAVRSLTSRSPP